MEDLDPPSALSLSPSDSISHALLCAFERDYTHLTVLDPENRSLLGYLSIPRLKDLLASKSVSEHDTVDKAMQRFKRGKAHVYKVITMDTPLEELEAFTIAAPLERWKLRRKPKRSSYVSKSGEGGNCGIVAPV